MSLIVNFFFVVWGLEVGSGVYAAPHSTAKSYVFYTGPHHRIVAKLVVWPFSFYL